MTKPMPSIEKVEKPFPVDDRDAFSDLPPDETRAKARELPVETLVSDGRAKNKPESAPDRRDPQDGNE